MIHSCCTALDWALEQPPTSSGEDENSPHSLWPESMMCYDLIIRAEDGSQPSSIEWDIEAARAQKLGMGVHLAEWDLLRSSV